MRVSLARCAALAWSSATYAATRSRPSSSRRVESVTMPPASRAVLVADRCRSGSSPSTRDGACRWAYAVRGSRPQPGDQRADAAAEDQAGEQEVAGLLVLVRGSTQLHGPRS